MEGLLIGLACIILGVAATALGVWNYWDWRAKKGLFEPVNDTGLGAWWKLAVRVQMFNNHLDIWIFFLLGPVLIALGIYDLIK